MKQIIRKNVDLKIIRLVGCFSLVLCIIFNLAYAEEKTLIPVGQTVGITLNLRGVTVTDTAVVIDYDGEEHSPAKDAGIKPGDIIEKINGVEIKSAAQLETLVNENRENPLSITVNRQEKRKELSATPALSCADGFYRLGVWIKDAASGIGTITYIDPVTNEFGALGHAISETPDSTPLPITGGDMLGATVVSIKKGEKGIPGELIGVFSEGNEKLGQVISNSTIGIKGKLIENTDLEKSTPTSVAPRHEVYEGNAEIISNIEGDNKETFSVEIQKINKDETNSRGMVIKITDNRLLEKTGGIVQGMSGSPIIQNGKLVGAVTHVFVNDPTRGYGIFIENMLSEAEKIK